MLTNIIGREREIKALDEIYNSSQSEFVAVSGKRSPAAKHNDKTFKQFILSRI